MPVPWHHIQPHLPSRSIHPHSLRNHRRYPKNRLCSLRSQKLTPPISSPYSDSGHGDATATTDELLLPVAANQATPMKNRAPRRRIDLPRWRIERPHLSSPDPASVVAIFELELHASVRQRRWIGQGWRGSVGLHPRWAIFHYRIECIFGFVFYLTGFLFFFFLGFNCSYHKDVFRPDLVRFWGNFGLNSIGFL